MTRFFERLHALEARVMIAALDVHYRDADATAACVLFRAWSDDEPASEFVEHCPDIAPYRPGAFYLRELPCLLRCLARIERPLDAVIIDGYVWLHDGSPALGGHLYRALDERVPVIGVAKNPFVRAGPFVPVLRGRSRRPLFVSAAGVDLPTAADHVRGMQGPHRIPRLLHRVDQLSRTG